MQFSQFSTVGRAGELLVCFDFAIRGYSAVINSFPGAKADVLVDLESAGFLRLQVKATSGPTETTSESRPTTKPAKRRATTEVFGYAQKAQRKYRFSIESRGGRGLAKYAGHVDLFAFVALDIKLILYLPAGKLVSAASRKVAFGCATFPERARPSLDSYLASLSQ